MPCAISRLTPHKLLEPVDKELTDAVAREVAERMTQIGPMRSEIKALSASAQMIPKLNKDFSIKS